MSRRLPLFVRKTLKDSSSPKLLLAFLIPYYGLAVLLAYGLSETAPDDLGSATLFTQEQVLIELYSQLAFVWLVAFPMVFVAVLVGITVAGEFQRGTFRILLSKPIGRWEPLLGKYVGVILFGWLVTLSGVLVGAVALYAASGASSLAIGNSIVTLLPGLLVYALFVTVCIASVALGFAVLTTSRLQTVLATALVPVLFFAFIFVRLLPAGDIYEQFHLYAIDINYHFGNVYVAINDVLGIEHNPASQRSLATVSGVFDSGGAWEDPLVGGIVGAVPLAGYVPLALSFGIVVVLSLAIVIGGVYQFERMDIS